MDILKLNPLDGNVRRVRFLGRRMVTERLSVQFVARLSEVAKFLSHIEQGNHWLTSAGGADHIDTNREAPRWQKINFRVILAWCLKRKLAEKKC